MCFSSVVMLVLVFALTATAQHRGGMGGGPVPGQSPFTNANPFPNQSGAFNPRVGAPSGKGWTGTRQPWRPGSTPGPCPFSSQGCHSAPPFWQPGVFYAPYPLLLQGWNGWPAYGSDGFYGALDPSYPGGSYMPSNYPQPSNVQVVLPAPYVVQTPSTTNDYNAGISTPGAVHGAAEARDAADGEISPETRGGSTTGASSLRIYQEPLRPPTTSDEHPTLIALKNRWAYTIVNYWVKGNTFHFITTQGDHMQVPVALVERIYSTSNQGHGTVSKLAPVR